MNKQILKISIVALIVGAMLLYMSFEGAAGFGLALTGTNFKADFNDYTYSVGATATAWQNGGADARFTWSNPTINPAGQLEMTTPSGAGSTGRCSALTYGLGSWPQQYTVEFRLKIDQFGAGEGFLDVGISDDTYWIQLIILKDHLWTGATATTENFTTTTDNGWHVWTLVCDHSGGSTYDVYRDSVKLTSFHYNVVTLSPKISLDAFGGMTNGISTSTTVHFDYFYIDQGLIPPGGGGTTYSLTVNAQTTTGTSVSGMQATLTGQGTLTLSPSATWSNLASPSVTVGIDASYQGTTYTFSYWLVGGANVGATNPRTGTLSAGSNTWTAVYSYTPPSSGPYTIIVQTKDSNGNNLNGVKVTFNNVAQYTSNGGTSFLSIPTGNYQVLVEAPSGTTFAHWEDSSTANPRSYSVSQTSTLTAYFSGSGPGPWDPLAGLRNLLNSFTVRNYELYIGAVVVLLGSIMLPIAMFAKKKTLAYVTA